MRKRAAVQAAVAGPGGSNGAVPRVAVSSTTTEENRTGSWKYIRPMYQDRVAPCNQGCPVGIDIEGYMNLVREGKADAAIDLLLRENPMPAVTGRVCHHPCETACNRRHFDAAVAIHAVERALGDVALRMPVGAAPVPTREERVAVIGAGPAGLACAYHLARLGYAVTVFDDAPEPGGMLRQGIPEYRLPRVILDQQIERIRSQGVEIRSNMRFGEEVDEATLREYDAVFLSTGAHRGKALGVPGEELPGVMSGLHFLKRVNAHHWPGIGRRVVVVGGGNTAMDCARTALRLGAKTTVLYRRTRAEMPAIPEEIDDAAQEGVEFRFLAAPLAFRASKDGELEAVECQRMELGAPDESGRRRPVPVEDGHFTLYADTVLMATGEDADLAVLPAALLVARGAVVVDGLGSAARLAEEEAPGGTAGGAVVRSRVVAGPPFFFAGGDLAGEERTVAHALGSGKRAAIGIDRHFKEWSVSQRRANGKGRRGKAAPRAQFRGQPPDAVVAPLRFGLTGNASITRWRGDDPIARESPVNEVVQLEELNLEQFAHAERHPDRRLPEEAARGFAEVNQGLDALQALEEAERCFNCGVCNECEVCLIFCPDVAIRRRADGPGYEIDLDHCKGCGICAEECPRGAIVMTREGL